MKPILYPLLFAFASIALGQGSGASGWPELTAARARYKSAIANDTKQYLQVLNQLRDNAIMAGNSGLAAAVSQEIRAMGGTDPSGADLIGDDASPSDTIKAKLLNTTWAWNGGETFTLLPDGKAKWSGANAATMTWKVVGSSPAKIEGIAHNGNKYKMILDADLQTGKLYEGTDSVRITALIPPK